MSAVIGAGTVFSGCTTLGGSYVAYAKIQSFTPGSVTAAKVAIDTFDATLLNSAVPMSDFITGWGSESEWKLKLVYDKTIYAALRALVGVAHFWKVIFTDGSGFNFGGLLLSVMPETPLKELITTEITIQPTGGAMPFLTVQT